MFFFLFSFFLHFSPSLSDIGVLSFLSQIGVPQHAAHLLLLWVRSRLQHLHEEIVDRHVADHLEEEQVLQALEPDGPDRWKTQQQLRESPCVVRPSHATVAFQGCVDLLAEQSHILDGLQTSDLGVKENDGPETAQLGPVHLHLAHFGHELRDHSVEYRADASLLRRVPIDGDPRRQYDTVIYVDGTVGKGGYQQLVPPGPEQKYLIVQRQRRKMRDVLRPCYQLEQLFVRGVANVRHCSLVVSLVLHPALDSSLGFQDALDRHVRVQAARALNLALIPLLGALTFLLDRLPFHPHRQTLLVSAVLTPIPLPLVDDAGLLLATGVGKVLADGPLEESFASFATVDAIVLAAGTVTADGAEVLASRERVVRWIGRDCFVLAARRRAQQVAWAIGPGGAEVPRIDEARRVGLHVQRTLRAHRGHGHVAVVQAQPAVPAGPMLGLSPLDDGGNRHHRFFLLHHLGRLQLSVFTRHFCPLPLFGPRQTRE